MKYNIVSRGPLRVTIAKDILPTPRLLSEGTRAPVEAYRAPWEDEDGPTAKLYPGGMWRVRDDSYDPPGTEYVKVMVDIEKEKMPWD